MIGSGLALLAEARRRGVDVWADGDQLRYRAPGRMPPGLLARLQEDKAGVLAVLVAACAADTARADDRGAEQNDGEVVDIHLDAADRAALEFLAGERLGGPLGSGGAYAERVKVNGVVIPSEWSRSSWRRELRRMADRCVVVRPDRAEELQRQADRLAESFPADHDENQG